MSPALWNLADEPRQTWLQLAPFGISSARQVTHIETDEGAETVTPSLGISPSFTRQQIRTFRLLPVGCGDVNGDGAVNMDDVTAFVAVLVGMPLDPADTARSDLNHDGVANGMDVASLVDCLLTAP